MKGREKGREWKGREGKGMKGKGREGVSYLISTQPAEGRPGIRRINWPRPTVDLTCTNFSVEVSDKSLWFKTQEKGCLNWERRFAPDDLRHKGREGKGEGKGWEGNEREGKGREWKGREGKGCHISSSHYSQGTSWDDVKLTLANGRFGATKFFRWLLGFAMNVV